MPVDLKKKNLRKEKWYKHLTNYGPEIAYYLDLLVQINYVGIN